MNEHQAPAAITVGHIGPIAFLRSAWPNEQQEAAAQALSELFGEPIVVEKVILMTPGRRAHLSLVDTAPAARMESSASGDAPREC